MQKNFALSRYPDSKECHVVECSDDGLMLYDSFGHVGEKAGFVFAPFDITPSTPLIVIGNESETVVDLDDMADTLPPYSESSVKFNLATEKLNLVNEKFNLTDEKTNVEETRLAPDGDTLSMEEDKSSYETDFSRFHSAVCSGKADKLVLSRKAAIKVGSKINPFVLFRNACKYNRHSFVALVSTSASGTWLTATPEILLERSGEDWRTIALAGTMAYNDYMRIGKWSGKNIREQKFVADYISDTIGKFTDDIQRSEPYTVRAGNIVHIRTDFSFHTDKGKAGVHAPAGIGETVSCLHPTPAVCGMPARTAHEFIKDNESVERKYYSGFCGMVHAGGDFNLYVTLRCMNINGDSADLYAGGGIMPDSKCEDEWRETVYKMQTMARCMDADGMA